MEDYTPKIVHNSHSGIVYGEMLVELKTCPKCNKYMIIKPNGSIDNSFPNYVKIDFKSQLHNAGWVEQSNVKVDNKYICTECVRNGEADFKCYLCGERYLVNFIQESFGDPPEFLCEKCYTTVSAKEWEMVTDKLYDIHKYDFE